MAADARAVAADSHAACFQEGGNPFVADAHVIRVTKVDDWRGLGIRLASAACGNGVAKMRAVGKDSVYAMTRGYVHARAIAALRGLDLQCTMGMEDILVGARADQVSAVILYAFARRPDLMTWEKEPAHGEAS